MPKTKQTQEITVHLLDKERDLIRVEESFDELIREITDEVAVPDRVKEIKEGEWTVFELSIVKETVLIFTRGEGEVWLEESEELKKVAGAVDISLPHLSIADLGFLYPSSIK